mmetsp:Transcript_50368/g.150572  ORF Transcript_50368/g.150572 Transcript_50368/m.150572 type:complete len:311 (+) Transcript_50368:77-1009(+)
MPPPLSLPIANRRVADPTPAVPVPAVPVPAPEAAQPAQHHGVRARVRELFRPLLPIKPKTTRSVNLTQPEMEAEVKSPVMNGGATRRASASSAAVRDGAYLMPPSGATFYTQSPGSSPCSPGMAAPPRIVRVQFASSPVSVKEYTPHDSTLSPWASPTAMSPNGMMGRQEQSPPSSCGSSPSPLPVMTPLTLFAPGNQEARGVPVQQAVAPGNQVATVVGAPQVVRVGKPVLPQAAVLPSVVAQGPAQTLTYLVPPASSSATSTIGPPAVQTVQHQQFGQVASATAGSVARAGPVVQTFQYQQAGQAKQI